MEPSIDDLRAARRRLQGRAVVTPLLESPELSQLAGTRVLLKAENLQRGGAFKFRGALNKMLQVLEQSAACRGFIAYSSGNHALAVSLAAAELGLPALVLMPGDAPAVKIDGARRYGAEVVLYDRQTDDREALCRHLIALRGFTLVPPYDDPDIMAGAGTGALEAIEQAGVQAGIDTFLVPCGGGGLTSGWATAARAALPQAHVLAVEPMGFEDTGRSLRKGERVRNERLTGTICDSLLVPTPGALTFAVMQQCAVRGVAVSDEEVKEAMRFAFATLKLVLEPGGAATLAAAMYRRFPASARCIVAVLSGGNVDADVLTETLLP